MKSTIFTEAENKSLEERQKGIKSDPNGIFANRVKPKIKEILEHWLPQAKTLKKIIKTKNDIQKRN